MTRPPRLSCLAVFLLHVLACSAPSAPPKEAPQLGRIQKPVCIPIPDTCFCTNGVRDPECEGPILEEPVTTTLTLEAAGLFTNPNPVGGQVPDGAMSRASNVVSDRPGVVTPRRGTRAWNYPIGSGETGESAFFYGGDLFVHTSGDYLRRDDISSFDVVLKRGGGLASVTSPTGGGRVRSAVADGKLYLVTGTGVQELDGAGGTLKTPGAPRALDVTSATMLLGPGTAGGHLPSGAVTAYRTVWGYNDSRGAPVLGEPSGRVIVKNATYPATLTRTSNVAQVSISPLAVPFDALLAAGDTVEITPTGTNNPAPAKKTITAATSSLFTYSETAPDLASTGGFTLSYGSRNTRVQVRIPDEVLPGDFLQIHRTASVISPFDDPGDNMAQVAEIIVTQAMINMGFILYDDKTPDALRQGPLYTNALQQGRLQANVRPPIAQDLTVFRDALFLANTQGPHRLTFRFLGLPDDGTLLTIGGQMYLANDGDPAPPGQTEFLVWRHASLTVSQQIEATAKSLIRAIVSNTSSPVTASYVSGDTDAPGIIMLEEKVISSTPFTVISSANGERFAPELVSAISSTQDVKKNRLHYSKVGLPYAFPLGNTLAVGSEDSEILRILALRDSLFVFKRGTGEGKGLYRVTGSGPGFFNVAQFNAGVDLIAPESAVVLDNQIFALTTAGIVSVSDSGVETISLPIENLVQDILVTAGSALSTVAHGAAYESQTERKYMLWVPDSSGGTAPSFAFVYNLNTDTWTTRDDQPACATVGGTGPLLHTCMGTFMHMERKTGTVQDFLGPVVFRGEALASTSTGFIADDVSGIFPGMAVWTGSGGLQSAQRVLAVDEATNMVTLEGGPLVSQGLPESLDAAEGINIGVAWTVNSAGDPSAQKQFFDSALLFEQTNTGEWTFNFSDDTAEPPVSSIGYAEGTKYVRAEVPWDVQRTTRLGVEVEHNVLLEKVDILGVRSLVNIYNGTLDP